MLVDERYVDARELAAVMDVSLTTIKRWTAAGMPSETWGLRLRRYRLSEATRWLRERDRVGRSRDRS